MASCLELIIDRIGRDGPLTVAGFMELALYHPDAGYYATVPHRSGRAGDFFTSVDVGPQFGELLGAGFAEMWREAGGAGPFDLVEAGASDGRLARDVVAWAAEADPAFYEALRLSLVELSPAARNRQRQTLASHADRLSSSTDRLPSRVSGVIYANELLDAMPVHLIEMTPGGLAEVFVDVRDGSLTTRLGPPSTPELARYLTRAGARLEPGWRADVNLAAVSWVGQAARALERGFLLFIDYGHEAAELFSATHPQGTLRAITRHVVAPEGGDPRVPSWLEQPGLRDLTTHVDLTSIRAAAEAAGLDWLGTTDQGFYLLGLGLVDRQSFPSADTPSDLQRRMRLKALAFPGGPGLTHQVMVFGRAVGRPPLSGLTFRERLRAGRA